MIISTHLEPVHQVIGVAKQPNHYKNLSDQGGNDTGATLWTLRRRESLACNAMVINTQVHPSRCSG
jgi:hypothetical protein